MRVIVAGSNGFIGTKLIQKLYGKGVEIIAIVQKKEMDISSIASYCAHIVYCDLTNIGNCTDILEDDREETVFVNLAWRGVNGIEKANYSYQLANIQMLCDSAQFAKKIGCCKYVAAGTVAENVIESLHGLSVISPNLFY